MTDLKQRVDHERDRLRGAHRRGEGGFALGRRLSRFWDKALSELFQSSVPKAMGASLCVTGSLGRREASPWSDVDFLILLPEGADTRDAEAAAESMMYALWDARIKTGHGFATVEQAIARAREDSEALTGLLDARHIAGDASLSTALLERLDAMIAEGETAGRIRRREAAADDPEYPPTVHVLEPDLKESPGGLRDFQVAVWSVQSHWGRGDAGEALVERGVMTRVGWLELRLAVDWMLRLRHEVQFRNRGPGDVLKTALQPEAAILLGYQGAGEAEAAKALLKDYFAAADRVTRFSQRVFEALLGEAEREPRDDIAPGASAHGPIVFLPKDLDSRMGGRALVDLFAGFAGTGLRLSQRSAARVADVAALVDDDFREDPETASAFLALLGRDRAGDSLRVMHATGLLGAYLPPFGGLRGLVPYDVFHSYPADEHTLIAVGFFDRLRQGMGPDPLPGLATTLRRPDLLRLAMLLHDAGKAGGPGHRERGGRMAPGVCLRLGLSEAETDFVVRLVKEHEALAHAAHTRDIEDPAVVRELAEKLGGDTELLDALYLLTYCDMRAVGPGVWTRWRADLLRALYDHVLAVMTTGRKDADRHGRADRVREALAPTNDAALLDRYLAQMEREHPAWLNEETAARHLAALAEFAAARRALLRLYADGGESWTAVMCAKDEPGLLAKAAAVFASENLNILGVQAFNTADGQALDTLEFFAPASDRPMEEWGERLTAKLRAVTEGARNADELAAEGLRKRVRGDAPLTHIATDVRIDNHCADRKTVVEVWTADRPGLLYRIASSLFASGLSIHLAKVNTIAGRAVDSFYVVNEAGEKVTGADARALRESLIATLS